MKPRARSIGPKKKDSFRSLVGDLSAEPAGIEQWERHLRRDFGNFLHSYSSNLLSLHHTLEIAAQQCGRDPFDHPNAGNFERQVEQLEQPCKRLGETLGEFIAMRSEASTQDALSEGDWETLEVQLNLLTGRRDQIPLGVRHVLYRESAQMVSEVMKRRRRGSGSRSLARRLTSAAQEMRRLATLLALHLAESRLIEMGFEAQSLRQLVTIDREHPEPKRLQSFSELVQRAAETFSEYSGTSGVKLELSDDGQDKPVLVATRQVERAIGNLIHNAIKYSWHQPGLAVPIRVARRQNRAVVTLENYGTPIAEDELPFLASIGFRGRFSGDRRRTGTGTGLADTARVARDHQGELRISSRPAVKGNVVDYSQPFLTKVEFALPIHRLEKGSE